MKGAVILPIAKGRRELGWETGFAAVAGTTSPNPVASIVLNNDADFVACKMTVMQYGAAAGNIPLPNTVVMNVRDGATGNVLNRQPGVPASFCSVPWPGDRVGNSVPSTGRWANYEKGLPSPFLIRRGSSVFFEFSNPAAYSFAGDLYVVLEGFRVYPGEKDPIPDQVSGYALPYSWAGTLVVPGGLPAGLQSLGTITMPGPGPGRFMLKYGAITSTALPTAQSNVLPPTDNVLALQVRDTLAQGKFWARMTTPPSNLGQYMPAAAFTGGGSGAPWAHPRYMDGVSTIFVDVFGDPSAFTGGTPGTVEVQLNGVLVLG